MTSPTETHPLQEPTPQPNPLDVLPRAKGPKGLYSARDLRDMRERLMHDFPTLDPMLVTQIMWLINRGCEYPAVADNGEPRIKLPQTGEFVEGG